MTTSLFNLTRYKNKIIAIDGPAGSGKSTTARLVAARLEYNYLDTGAMYRAITHFALEHGVAPSDGPKLTTLAEKLSIEFETHEDVNRIFLNGKDVTSEIREPEVTKHVSEVSAHKGVREALVARQRDLGKDGSVVAEGRDTTTVVFPNAHLKIFLSASIRERAERRMIDLSKMNVTTTLEEQMADIERRDEYDSNRQHSPLTKAKDAHTVDTSNCTIEEQVERVLSLFRTVMK
jgi:cytidylate kinase